MVSQDRDKIYFSIGLPTGLFIVGVFHTMYRPDIKMSIFQGKKTKPKQQKKPIRHQQFIVIIATIFNYVIVKLLKKMHYFYSKIIFFYLFHHLITLF